MLDLPYAEDSRAEVDMNVVMTGAGRFVEVQGTAEGMAFSRTELDELLALAEAGIAQLGAAQQRGRWPPRRHPRRPTPGERDGEGRPSGPLTLVLATANPDKTAEIAAILGTGAIELLPRPPDLAEVEETGDDPARQRPAEGPGASPRPPGAPRWPTTRGWRWTPLGARPGCGRPASPANSHLRRQRGEAAGRAGRADPIGGGDRRARFVTVALVWFPDGSEVAAEGSVDGRIAPEPRGTAGSVTTRSSFPTAPTGGRSPRCRRRRSTHRSHRGRAFRALLAAAAGRLTARGRMPGSAAVSDSVALPARLRLTLCVPCRSGDHGLPRSRVSRVGWWRGLARRRIWGRQWGGTSSDPEPAWLRPGGGRPTERSVRMGSHSSHEESDPPG